MTVHRYGGSAVPIRDGQWILLGEEGFRVDDKEPQDHRVVASGDAPRRYHVRIRCTGNRSSLQYVAYNVVHAFDRGVEVEDSRRAQILLRLGGQCTIEVDRVKGWDANSSEYTPSVTGFVVGVLGLVGLGNWWMGGIFSSRDATMKFTTALLFISMGLTRFRWLRVPWHLFNPVLVAFSMFVAGSMLGLQICNWLPPRPHGVPLASIVACFDPHSLRDRNSRGWECTTTVPSKEAMPPEITACVEATDKEFQQRYPEASPPDLSALYLRCSGVPGLMAFQTALAVLLLAMAEALSGASNDAKKRARTIHSSGTTCALLAFLVAAAGFLGHASGAHIGFQIPYASAIAPTTAIGLMLVASNILVQYPTASIPHKNTVSLFSATAVLGVSTFVAWSLFRFAHLLYDEEQIGKTAALLGTLAGFLKLLADGKNEVDKDTA